MNAIGQHLGLEQIDLEKVLNFLPYPFLVSELHNGRQHNRFINGKFHEEIGYSLEEIPTIDEWFLRAYPDAPYRATVMRDWADQEKLERARNEDFLVLKAKIRTKHSGDLWYEVKASVSGPVRLVAFININAEVLREEELHRLNANKDRILSILSHDLRMPLTNLHSLLQLSRKGMINDEEYALHLQKVSDKTFRLLEFLDNTLEWTRTNFSSIEPVKAKVYLNRVIREIIEVYQPICTDKGISLHVGLDDGQEIVSDPHIISVIFRNIFSNAIKFTNEGDIWIRYSQEGEVAEITVTDTGVGIPEEKIRAIIAGNYQSELGTRQEKGLGVGLRLCFELCRKIKARLHIDSAPGVGTSVTLRIP